MPKAKLHPLPQLFLLGASSAALVMGKVQRGGRQGKIKRDLRDRTPGYHHRMGRMTVTSPSWGRPAFAAIQSLTLRLRSRAQEVFRARRMLVPDIVRATLSAQRREDALLLGCEVTEIISDTYYPGIVLTESRFAVTTVTALVAIKQPRTLLPSITSHDDRRS